MHQHLLSILLQVEPTATFWQRIGDQAFTVVLLATISWLLWQRITKVQDRMDSYLNEDRKQMSEVINSVKDQMKESTDVFKEVVNQLKQIQNNANK
jgi:hypothetical protein